MASSKEMAKLVIHALENKKAEDIRIIDIRNVSVFATGNNRNQIQAMIDHVEEEMQKAGYVPKQIEGYQNANWILMDYLDIVVHVFDSENRLFYDLERVWRDGQHISLEDLGT